MKSIIKKMLYAGIRKFAKLYEVSEDKIQFLIFARPGSFGSPLMYWVYVDGQPKKEISFKEAIDKDGKLSFVNHEAIATQFIANKLNGYIAVDKIEPDKISFMLYEFKNDINISVFDGSENIDELTLNDLFE
mgnify:CR=1 FL=1